MITALKQYGTNYARRTIRRQLINYAIGGALVITGGAYYLITGKPYPGAESSEPEPAPVVHHHVPKPAPAKPAAAAAAPAASATPTPGAPITAQGIDINAPKRAAQKAVAAENAQLAAQTGQDVAAAQPISGPGSTPSAVVSPAGALPAERALEAAASNAVTREVYSYGGVGRRDPFYSLILTDDLRPLLSDLRLVGILYETSGGRAVAVMRDVLTNAQYRVQNGQSLGRMRVTQIRPRAVLFTIEEFGLSRQDSLVWTDTLKVRN
jgi:hypothetical protein